MTDMGYTVPVCETCGEKATLWVIDSREVIHEYGFSTTSETGGHPFCDRHIRPARTTLLDGRVVNSLDFLLAKDNP